MKTLTSSLQKIGLKTGLLTALALIIYFLIMKLLGMERMLSFRYFNFFILFIALSYSIYKLKHEYPEEDFYLKGMAVGFYTCAIASFVFAFFISVYLTFFDHDLMNYIRSTTAHGLPINGPAVFLILVMEGMASGTIITFALMQWFKSRVTTHAHQPE